jgi:hypothetical protein
MQLKNIFIGATVFLTASFFTISCVRERDTETEIASDNVFGEFIYNDVATIMDDANDKNPGEQLSNYKTTSNCATISKTSVGTTNTITVDFGPTNCICSDGRNRRGKINLLFTGNYHDVGSNHQITFDNYFINNNHVKGTKTVTNMGLNNSSQNYYTIVTNGQIVKADSQGTITWNANRTRTWIAGEGTAQWTDDVYKITGTGNGTNKNGVQYSTNITKPLIKAMPLVCKYVSEGTIEMQPQGKALRTIDFGTGDCDNIATVVINNKTYNINLK